MFQFLFLVSLIFFNLSQVYAQGATTVVETKKTIETKKEVIENKPVLYELVQDNLKPEPDEFYLTMLFGTNEQPKALIKRSTNSRASDVYYEGVAYGIGDKIAEDLVVEAIDLKSKEVIVKKISTNEYYSIRLSYGDAVSRLMKKQNYKEDTLTK